MNQITRGSWPWCPSPICLMGANVNGKPTYVALGNVGVMGFNPGVVYCGSHRSHYTNRGVNKNGTFSVNYPSVDLVKVTDLCGMVSGKDVDKGAFFTNFYGELETAPMIKECPVNLECRLINRIEIHENEIFIGAVVETYLCPDLAKDLAKWPDLHTVNPLVLSLDYHYWTIGKCVAKEGFSVKRC